MKLRIPRDQLLAFEQELLEAARSFLSIKDPSYSQATLARARATPETAQGCERVRRRDCANAYVDRDFSASHALVWSVLNIASRRGGTVAVDKKDGGTLDRFFAAASELDVWTRGCAPQGLTSSRLYRLHRQWRAFLKADIK